MPIFLAPKQHNPFRWFPWLWLFGLVLASIQAKAQDTIVHLHITYPVSRMVVQRDNNNQASVQVAGSYDQPVDLIQARAVPRIASQGTPTDWTPLSTSKGQFSGTLAVKGGWYQLEVRALKGNQPIGSDTLDRFGVGEVFAIVGHSDAQGSDCVINGVNRCPTLEGATDDRVTVVGLDQSSPAFKKYLETADSRYLPGLAFSQLSTFGGIAPFAKIAWFWGHMGEIGRAHV